jgi:hypothetical protein
MADDWRRSQTDPSRAEAIRIMVELATKEKKRPDTDRGAPNTHDELAWIYRQELRLSRKFGKQKFCRGLFKAPEDSLHRS